MYKINLLFKCMDYDLMMRINVSNQICMNIRATNENITNCNFRIQTTLDMITCKGMEKGGINLIFFFSDDFEKYYKIVFCVLK